MNKSVNENFLEEEVEYEEVPEDQITDADEVLEEIEGEIEEETRQVEEAIAAMSEVEKRIEQANLYKAVLNAQLFAPNSARPEIIRAVDREFKDFVRTRLEVLLGIRPEGQRPGQKTAGQFSDEEVQAIKALVGRLIAKGQAQAPANPQINQVQAPTPRVTQVQTRQVPVPAVQQVQAAPQQIETQQVAPRMVKRVVSRKVNGQAVQSKPVASSRSRRPKSNNVATVTGEDLSQAVNPAMPPRKMPSQAQMDMMNANTAARNAGGASPQTPFTETATTAGMGQGALNLALNTILKR